MKKQKEESLQTVLEDVTFILNEMREKKIPKIEEAKLTPQQEKIIKQCKNDLIVCATKLGLILHSTEL